MTKTKMNQIKTAIKAGMEAKEWSVEVLAVESCVGRDAIYRFMAGTQDMRSESLEKIFAALGIQLVIKKQNRPSRPR